MHGPTPKPFFSTSFETPQAVKDYVGRIRRERSVEIEQKGPRKFVVLDPSNDSHYPKYKAVISIGPDGSIDYGDDEAYAPTDDEKKAIADAAGKLPKSIAATKWDYEELLLKKRLFVGPYYPVYDSAREKIIAVEDRRERDGKKSPVLWTLFIQEGKTPEWHMAWPDGRLPFWKPWRHRKDGKVVSKNLASIMVHEGAKAAAFIDGLLNDPDRREERKRHPWADDLADYEHWGTLGGVHNTRYMDFDELRGAGILGNVVYVCDNDDPGREAVKLFSQDYGRRMETVMFDNRFPVA